MPVCGVVQEEGKRKAQQLKEAAKEQVTDWTRMSHLIFLSFLRTCGYVYDVMLLLRVVNIG